MDSTELRTDEIDEHVWEAIVTDPVREEVLAVLAELERPISLADLAMELARETDAEFEGTDWERAKRFRTALHHRHVPKLQFVGLVEFDPEWMTVTLV